ncbi:MAG: hypothetical protein ACRC1U_01250 [Vibrionaceae bacterium]
MSSGYSEVRTEGGATCRSNHAGNVQVYGGVYGDTQTNPYNYGASEDKGAFVGINISIGGGKILDCSKLYELETTRAQLELERLKAEITQLKQLQAIQNGSGLNIPLPLNH